LCAELDTGRRGDAGKAFRKYPLHERFASARGSNDTRATITWQKFMVRAHDHAWPLLNTGSDFCLRKRGKIAVSQLRSPFD
jgi:hypothetical protein